MSKDWVLPKTWGDWALGERKDWSAENVRLAADKFRDHWLAKVDGDRLDWEATWRNWVRSEIGKPALSVVPGPLQEKPPEVCACCGATASKRIGARWFCGEHDQFTTAAVG